MHEVLRQELENVSFTELLNDPFIGAPPVSLRIH